MSALLLATIKVKDQEKLKSYISQVPATMAPYGAKMIARGKVLKVLSGEFNHQIEAIFEFPDAASIDSWYESSEYQALIPLRNEGAHMNIAILDSF